VTGSPIAYRQLSILWMRFGSTIDGATESGLVGYFMNDAIHVFVGTVFEAVTGHRFYSTHSKRSLGPLIWAPDLGP
jgi:hypothetical protein